MKKSHVCDVSLQWRHNDRDNVSNHQPHDCLFNCLFRRRSKKTSKLRVTGLCAGNSPGTGEFPAQRSSKAENVSIWWRHYVCKNTTPSHRPWYFLPHRGPSGAFIGKTVHPCVFVFIPILIFVNIVLFRILTILHNNKGVTSRAAKLVVVVALPSLLVTS